MVNNRERVWTKSMDGFLVTGNPPIRLGRPSGRLEDGCSRGRGRSKHWMAVGTSSGLPRCSEGAREGIVYMKRVRSCLSPIHPSSRRPEAIEEMRTAKEVVVVCGSARVPGRRGCGRRPAFEFMFEDGSQAPMNVWWVGEDQVDWLMPSVSPPCDDFPCLVYTEGPKLFLDMPARYRVRRTLPCMERWNGR